MSDLEFDVLDELYFIKSFDEIMEAMQLESRELRTVLMKIFDKGWIRCYRSANNEVMPENVDIEIEYPKYLYLASRAGLKAHNS